MKKSLILKIVGILMIIVSIRGVIFVFTDKEFDYAGMIANIDSYPYMYLGTGAWWGSAACYLSDLRVYNKAMGSSDIQALIAKTENPTGIKEFKAPEIQSNLKSGKFVENGKIVIYKEGKRYNLQGQRID